MKRQNSPRTEALKFAEFVRKPFIIEAVEITPANIYEVAKFVGEVREDHRGTKYILVDNRLVPNVERVYVGFFLTKMGNNIRCYGRHIFFEQFVEMDDELRELVALIEMDPEELEDDEVGEGNRV